MEFGRRELLQAALFGTAGIAVAGAGPALTAPAAADPIEDGVDVAQGTLLSVQGSVASLQLALGVQAFDLANANVWRGAYDLAPATLQVGDDLMVKTVAGTAVAAWSNFPAQWDPKLGIHVT